MTTTVELRCIDAELDRNAVLDHRYSTTPVGVVQMKNIPRQDETVWIDFGTGLGDGPRNEYRVRHVIHSIRSGQVVLLLVRTQL